jgi:nucleoside-diphosphate-sugar epimerase
VCGRQEGVFCEQDLDLRQEFRNAYEQSKYEAELLLSAASDLPVVVARPSIVVGNSESGWTSAFNVIYGPMRAFARGMLEEVPANPGSIVDFVPIDYVTAALMHLLDDEAASGNYHLVAGDLAFSAGELASAQAELLGRPPMRLLPQEECRALPEGIATYAPYLDIRCEFDDARARAALEPAGITAPAPGDYLHRLVEFALRTRFGKQRISREAAFSAALAARCASGR